MYNALSLVTLHFLFLPTRNNRAFIIFLIKEKVVSKKNTNESPG